MAKRSQKSRPQEPPAPAPQPARRSAPRRASAERRLRIVERLTTGLSVAHIARVEGLTVRRVQQIIAATLDSREVDPPADFVQLQVARLGAAMVVAHTMMMQGDLQAMDRMIKLTGELDRYHGFAGVRLLAPAGAAPQRLAPPPPRPALSANPEREATEAKFSLPQRLENSVNAEIHAASDPASTAELRRRLAPPRTPGDLQQRRARAGSRRRWPAPTKALADPRAQWI